MIYILSYYKIFWICLYFPLQSCAAPAQKSLEEKHEVPKIRPPAQTGPERPNLAGPADPEEAWWQSLPDFERPNNKLAPDVGFRRRRQRGRMYDFLQSSEAAKREISEALPFTISRKKSYPPDRRGDMSGREEIHRFRVPGEDVESSKRWNAMQDPTALSVPSEKNNEMLYLKPSKQHVCQSAACEAALASNAKAAPAAPGRSCCCEGCCDCPGVGAVGAVGDCSCCGGCGSRCCGGGGAGGGGKPAIVAEPIILLVHDEVRDDRLATPGAAGQAPKAPVHVPFPAPAPTVLLPARGRALSRRIPVTEAQDAESRSKAVDPEVSQMNLASEEESAKLHADAAVHTVAIASSIRQPPGRGDGGGGRGNRKSLAAHIAAKQM